MAQRKKEELRRSILAAGARVFARDGYERARLTDIAAEAGTVVGNLYRYFPGKEALFAAVVPRGLAARMLLLMRARARELRGFSDWSRADASGSEKARELLAFWIAHRLETVILLGGAQGSPLGFVRGLAVRELTRLAAQSPAASRGDEASRAALFVIGQIFVNTVDMIVAILRDREDPQEIALAFAAFWRFQLSGLRALLADAGPAG